MLSDSNMQGILIMKNIIVLNVGGSSIKCRVYLGRSPFCDMSLSKIGLSTQVWMRACIGMPCISSEVTEAKTIEGAATFFVRQIKEFLSQEKKYQIDIVIARIKFSGYGMSAAKIDETLRQKISFESSLGQGHSELTLAILDRALDEWVDLECIGVFDDFFFRHVIPGELQQMSPVIRRRYLTPSGGHHGLACEAVVEQLRHRNDPLDGAPTIMCHVGSGVSVTALQNRLPLSNSMPFAACDGPMMNNRSGSVRPGLVLQLIKNGFPAGKLAELLTYECGVQKVWCQEGDGTDITTERILDRYFESNSALAYFDALAREIAGAAVQLKEVKGIVISGGVGVRSVKLVAELSKRLWFLRIKERENEHQDKETVTLIKEVVDEQAILFARGMKFYKEQEQRSFRGTCICPGIARGRVANLDPSAQGSRGHIVMVEALTPLVALESQSAGCILAHHGEPTCHGAALCRELMIPTMTNVDVEEIQAHSYNNEITVDCGIGGGWINAIKEN